MSEEIHFSLRSDRVEELRLFKELLHKDYNTMLDEALELYFDAQRRRMLEKNLEDENMETNLDYEEFWDGVDL
ncbi:MAG TPA: hypothetical protein ENK71_00665 [Epsilonproteobacteria bacterium]|nr:hypothetical protein [Campylobacterota bacterium]